jgi:hypothetical protein
MVPESMDVSVSFANFQNNIGFMTGLLNELNSKLNEKKQIYDDQFKKTFTTTHDQINEYLQEILVLIIRKVFLNMRTAFGNWNNNQRGSVYGNATLLSAPNKRIFYEFQAIQTLFSLSGTEAETLFNGLREASRQSFLTLFQYMNAGFEQEFMRTFSSRIGASPAPANQLFYYLLRSIMYSRATNIIKLSRLDVTEQKIKATLMKICVDMYIKVCYPMLHFDYIDVSLKTYIDNGDFMNSRFALLAKIMYTFTVVDYLRTKVPNVDPTKLSSVFGEFDYNIKMFLTRLNNMTHINDPTSDISQVKNVLETLKTKSDTVVSTSIDIQRLKSNLENNQLTLRSLTKAMNSIRGRVSAKEVEYYIVLSLCVVVIVACTALYLLNMVEYGFWLAVIVTTIILTYMLIMKILTFIMKN